MSRAQIALIGCTAVPGLGLAVNLAWPAPEYGYLRELAGLIALGLLALVLERKSSTVSLLLRCTNETVEIAAVLFYFTGALVPVGAMLAHWGGSSPLVFVPHLGIIIVALTLRNERAAICYGLAALVGSGVFGFLANDEGLAGALAFLSGGLSAGALWWVRDYSLESKLERAYNDLNDVQRGLKHITGELGNVPKRE